MRGYLYKRLYSLRELDQKENVLTVEARQESDGRWRGVICRWRIDAEGKMEEGVPWVAYPPFMIAGAPEEIAAAWKAMTPQKRAETIKGGFSKPVSPEQQKAERRQSYGCMAMFIGAQALFVLLVYWMMNSREARIVPVGWLIVKPFLQLLGLPFTLLGASPPVAAALGFAAALALFDYFAWRKGSRA